MLASTVSTLTGNVVVMCFPSFAFFIALFLLCFIVSI